MTLEDVLNDLILQLVPERDFTLGWEQVREWPEDALGIFQKAGWIKPKAPAKSVVCPGCEENCFMPVNVSPIVHGKPIRAFVACDRRDDMGNIPIPPDNLKQWQITEKQIAEWITRELGIRGTPKKDKETRNFIIEGVQGRKKTGRLELACMEPVSLKTSGHSLHLNEIVFLNEDQITLDWQAIFNMIDRPPSLNRHKPSIARREVNKLDTQTRHKGWQKAYRELKRTNPNKSDNWCALQITKMPIGKGKSKETIRKNMKGSKV